MHEVEEFLRQEREGDAERHPLQRPVPHAPRTAWPLKQRAELALGLRIPLNVALRHGQAGMAREFLHVPEAPPDLGHFAGSARNEGTAAGMRRTAIHLERGIEPMKP